MTRDVRVLLVDDNDDVRQVVKFILEGEGFIVMEAASAEEGLELWPSFAPSVIVTDNNMPGLAGLKGASMIRRKVQIPTVVFSGTASRQFIEEAAKEGIHVVQKPEFNKLIEAVKKLTQRPEQ